MKKLKYFLGCGLLFSVHASAELEVIADLGGESAVRFYEGIQPVHSQNAPVHPDAISGEISESMLLPVISHKWQVGEVETKQVHLPGAMPIFLIGADDVSKQWLKTRYQDLIKLSATGLIINVNTPEELAQLRSLAPELSLMLVSADSLADRIGIHHYPLLITESQISQ
ncbi:integrating conjugative element protein [Rodentibacter haemolyticus]|uniref:Integrating conjugative element protein n=1 Tax=Rodentibacter haemolyticus TaxID=2778911 RepID=A0ABX6UZQ6_9PAST|nr:integrating conjugative element protein [Rodentibacter haemolyticus]QPB42858.1 integrating conjugative element protein [Rodentibacter haemolyticus]